MKFNSHLQPLQRSSSFEEAAAMSTESTGNKRAPEAPPPPDFQPENKKPRRDYFAPLRAWQNAASGQSSDTRPSAREQAKEHITPSDNEASRSEGRELLLRQESNVAWENPAGPILIKRELSLQQLKLTRADFANGSFGSVSIFENENGDQLIGKVSNNNTQTGKGFAIGSLDDELKAYQTIYDAVGPHPNLVHLYGIAQVRHKEETKLTLLMDFIPGPNGKGAFDALRKCRGAGKISSEQYWGAMQYIARRLLDVTRHLGKAGMVHNDIKPENFLVNEKTGEPVLIDIGLSTKKDAVVGARTPAYAAPEAKEWIIKRVGERGDVAVEGVDERSDVFSIGASLLDGIKGGKIKMPKREADTYSAKTAFMEFINSVMEPEKERRVDSREAKNLDFLKLRMLDDDAAKEIIKKAIALASIIEKKKPAKEQGKQVMPQLFSMPKRGEKKRVLAVTDASKSNPAQEDHARLRDASKDDTRTRRNRRLASQARLQVQYEQNMKNSGMQFMTDATWYRDAKGTLEAVPEKIKSGVDKDGRRLLYGGNKNIDPDYERSVILAREKLAPYAADIENLRRYANGAENFLLNAGKLKTINDHELVLQIEQVRDRAAVARRIVEIFDVDLSEPKKGNVQEHAPELKSVLLSGQSKKDKFQERSLELENLLGQMKWPNNPPSPE